MSLKERLRRQLASARDMSERLLEDFRTPEEWTRQVHPQTNHALWFAGHMGITDDFWISLVAPEQQQRRTDLAAHFGMGSQPTSDPAAYPPVEDVLAYMRERRRTLLAVLDSLSEDDLSRSTPDGAPDFLSDVASVFEAAIWHEGMHSGQLTVARRALGHGPLFSPGK